MNRSGIGRANRHILTVSVQELFQNPRLGHMIDPSSWSRFRSRISANTDRMLDLLRRCRTEATFFVPGWIADVHPEAVQRIVRDGHEIASSGYWMRHPDALGPDRFRADLRAGAAALEAAGANIIRGYRYPVENRRNPGPQLLSCLAEEGYLYDSSLRPVRELPGTAAGKRFASLNRTDHGRVWEFPESAASLLGIPLETATGCAMRFLPPQAVTAAFRLWRRHCGSPYVLSLSLWELDPEQPVYSSVTGFDRTILYSRLGRPREVLPRILQEDSFGSILGYLGRKLEYPEVPPCSEGWHRVEARKRSIFDRKPAARLRPDRKRVTVVVPCYREAENIPFLDRALRELSEYARERFEISYLFVDDGSSDDTGRLLRQIFGHRSDCRIFHHPERTGAAGAIRTGIRLASTDLVCSIDADCSYDPLDLPEMIDLLEEERADLVTASPYHYRGALVGASGWRLFVGRTLARMYRLVFEQKLGTYTSCCRVYRRSTVLGLLNEYGDDRGIPELLARLDTHGRKIAEYPTTRQSRVFGVSKRGTLESVTKHLLLLAEIGLYRRRFRRSLSDSRHQREQRSSIPRNPKNRRFS